MQQLDEVVGGGGHIGAREQLARQAVEGLWALPVERGSIRTKENKEWVGWRQLRRLNQGA